MSFFDRLPVRPGMSQNTTGHVLYRSWPDTPVGVLRDFLKRPKVFVYFCVRTVASLNPSVVPVEGEAGWGHVRRPGRRRALQVCAITFSLKGRGSLRELKSPRQQRGCVVCKGVGDRPDQLFGTHGRPADLAVSVMPMIMKWMCVGHPMQSIARPQRRDQSLWTCALQAKRKAE